MTYRFSALITKEDGWYVAELSKGTLSDILKPCGLKLNEFVELL